MSKPNDGVTVVFAEANVVSAEEAAANGLMEEALRKFQYAARGLSRLDGLAGDAAALNERAHRGIVRAYLAIRAAKLNVEKSGPLNSAP